MQQPRQYKYTSRFTATARCTLDVEQSKNLALASVKDLQSILPADAHLYPDLLPIAANACVANLGNVWGDLIDTDIAKKIHPKFINKFINLEHDRSQIVGVITTAGLSEFNSNYALGSGSKIIKPEEISGYNPFNISVGGYIWRMANPDIAAKILESNDPDSPIYLGIAMSWELGFDDYILMAGSKDRNDDVELITDPAKIQAYASCLKSKGGKNQLPDGRPLYRIIVASTNEDGSPDENSVVPLGVGLTFTPAGAVAGIVTPHFEVAASVSENNNQESEKNSSQKANGNVTVNIQKSMKTLKSLADLKNLNDENAKEYSFANVPNLIEAQEQAFASAQQSEINKQVTAAVETASKEWQAKVEAEKNAASKAQQEAAAALAKVDEVAASLQAANDKLAALEKAQEEAKASQTFNERMAFFDENYDLTDADRKALASRVKTLDEASFTEFAENEFAVFAAAKKKGVNPFAKKGDDAADEKDKANEDLKKKKAKDAAKASSEAVDKDAAEQALASAKQVEGQDIPNSPTSPEATLKDKYAKLFKLGAGVTVTKK